jgi:hypothetical protein
MSNTRLTVKVGDGYQIVEESEDYSSRDYEMRGERQHCGTKKTWYLIVGEWEVLIGSYGYLGLYTIQELRRKVTKAGIRKLIKLVSSNDLKRISDKKMKLDKLSEELKQEVTNHSAFVKKAAKYGLIDLNALSK